MTLKTCTFYLPVCFVFFSDDDNYSSSDCSTTAYSLHTLVVQQKENQRAAMWRKGEAETFCPPVIFLSISFVSYGQPSAQRLFYHKTSNKQ